MTERETITERTTDDADGRATIAQLSTDVLPRLIERITKSELGELEVREDGWRIRLRRPLAQNAAALIPLGGAGEPSRGGTSVSSPHTQADGRTGRGHQPVRPDGSRGLVTSPAVGYFSPVDAVTIGAEVRQGDLIGHVDVLGVRQEVVAPVDGVLRKLEVESGQAVEYGQPLARVEPGV